MRIQQLCRTTEALGLRSFRFTGQWTMTYTHIKSCLCPTCRAPRCGNIGDQPTASGMQSFAACCTATCPAAGGVRQHIRQRRLPAAGRVQGSWLRLHLAAKQPGSRLRKRVPAGLHAAQPPERHLQVCDKTHPHGRKTCKQTSRRIHRIRFLPSRRAESRGVVSTSVLMATCNRSGVLPVA